MRVPTATRAKHVRCVFKELHLTLEVRALTLTLTLTLAQTLSLTLLR